jgi:hypothetical protein
MRLSGFINEGVVSRRDEWNFDEVLDLLKKMDRSDPVLWKGWSKRSDFHGSGWMVKVKSDREGFRGSFLPSAERVIEKLDLPGSPVFTTTDLPHSAFFGTPYVFIPIGPFTTFYNPEIWDLAQVKRNDNLWKSVDDDKINQVVGGYKVSNKIPDGAKGEVIVIVDYYWLLSVGSLINETKGKLKIISNTREVKKYGDVIEVMENYLKFYRWKLKKQIENDPAFIRVIRTWNIPKEWIRELEAIAG